MEAVKPTPLLPKGALIGGRVQPPPEFLAYWHSNDHLSIHQAARDMHNWISQFEAQEATNDDSETRQPTHLSSRAS